MAKQIREVLVCRPIHYSVEYTINPWMKPGSVDKQKATEQWEKLIEIYKKLSIKVNVIDQEVGVPDMVFATDQGIVDDGKVLLSNFRYQERRKEQIHYGKWFLDHGYTLTHLPENIFFEGGGECIVRDAFAFLGVGFRSSPQTPRYLVSFLDREVIPLQLIDPYFYHLDTCLFCLDEKTAFYYPHAFSEESIEDLQEHIPNLISFTSEEAKGFSSNSVVSGDTVICQVGNPTFKKRIEELGYEMIEINIGEFIKAGGGIHCLTNILS